MIAAANSSSQAQKTTGPEPYFAIELQQKAPVENEPSLTDLHIPQAPLGEDVTHRFAQRDRPDNTIGRGKTRTREPREQKLFGGLGDRLASLFSALLPAKGEAVPADKIEALEDRAVEVLEGLMPKTIGQAEQVFGDWFVDLEARAANKGPITAMEYLTVLHVLREKLFEKAPELAPYVERMQSTLGTMRGRLVGDDKSGELTDQRLPRRFLLKQSRDVQAIHTAVFRPSEDTLGSAISGIAQNYLPRAHDAAIAAGVLALCFHHTGVEVLAGAVSGYLIGTFIEHAIHKHIGHASKRSLERLEKILSKFGPIGRAIHHSITETAFSHGTVHHASYAGDYVDRFAPRDKDLPKEVIEQKRDQKKQTIDKMIEARGPEAMKEILASDYGRSLAHALKDALIFAPITALATLGTALIANLAGADVGILYALVSVATSLLFIPASKDLHPYLHMPREEALAKAGPLMRGFLNSRYVASAAQSHYLHHRDAAVNQNLVLGADFALGHKTSPVEAVLALRKLKTFY